MTVSIIGFGWLGLALAERLASAGFKVIGSVTSTEKLDALAGKAFRTYQLSLKPEPSGDLTALLQANTLLINVPPKAGKLGDDFHPAQVEHLITAIQQSPVQHIIYASSTSVYPELNRVVTEEDIVDGQQSPAPGLIRAEQLVQQLAPERLTTVVRFGGLMGYDRIPAKYVAGRTVDTGAVPVNYVHRDDAVAILQALIQNPTEGVFNAVAPEHPNREAVYRKSCLDFGYTLPTFVKSNESASFKIISSEKLRQTTQYIFKYPDPLQFFYSQ